MTEKLTQNSYKYLMEITYQRIEQKKLYDLDFKPYSNELLRKLIEHFEEEEEYEKCNIINNIITNKKKHEENYDNRRINS